MKIKPVIFLLALICLFLFCGFAFGQQKEWKIESHYKNWNEVEVVRVNNDDVQEKSSLRLKNRKLPEELIKVKKYILENDYPEVFGEENYRVAVDGFEIVDFWNDGLVEVIILFSPHYLQSPTIVIYQIQKDGSVKRIREALAPGPLVKRKNYFLDSHELGEGIDLALSGKRITYEKRKALAKLAAKKKAGLIVQYKNFTHVDGRKGENTYIDMSHVEPFDSKQTCASFEFSKVDFIYAAVGSREDNKNLGAILAKVGNQVYMYEIAGIDKDGYLDKKISVMKAKSY